MYIYSFRSTEKTRYRTSFKLETVEEVEAGMHPDEVTQNLNVSRSNVIKWVQQKEKLIDAAKSECKIITKLYKQQSMSIFTKL